MFGDTMYKAGDIDPLDELAASVRAAREKFDEAVGKNQTSADTEFYIVVVFRNAEQVSEFLRKHNLPDNRYQSGEELMRLCGDEP